ncbi:MAG: hypothetical protein JST00_21365 [Deltaproteobacteria bacterium]|nr:hypothetical protein [Deltaproteobacteria bacterium]
MRYPVVRLPMAPSIPPSSIPQRPSRITREREALLAHRASLAGAEVPLEKPLARGTFLHGFFLPFSLVAATLRDPELRRPYLRVTAIRLAVVAVIALLAFSGEKASSPPKPHLSSRVSPSAGPHAGPRVVIDDKGSGAKPLRVDIPGVHVDLDPKHGKEEVVVLGQHVPVVAAKAEGDGAGTGAGAHDGEARPSAEPAPAATFFGRAWATTKRSWAWLLALIAFLSGAEAVVVFLSRRYDDWLSFHASRLARIRPEDESPKERKIAFDLGWLWRKLKRRIRGYVVFGAGIPALLPLRLLPEVGPWVFNVALTLWAWYWLGVFTAAKSAHAWADEGTAPSPRPIRLLEDRVSKGFLVSPLRLYARAWAWITRSVNPAAATFERSPAAYLGLALARAILSLPGLYLLSRPLVPVAAGRICAESDPGERFSLPPTAIG